jgi:hypothetical protein
MTPRYVPTDAAVGPVNLDDCGCGVFVAVVVQWEACKGCMFRDAMYDVSCLLQSVACNVWDALRTQRSMEPAECSSAVFDALGVMQRRALYCV